MAQSFRRNNPGNIRYNPANKWQGQQGNNGGFVQFDNLSNGIRAFVKLLANYRSMYGLNTIGSLVTRYAPPIENNTANYITFVSKQTGIARNKVLQPEDYDLVIPAMIRIETGITPNRDTLELISGYRRTFLGKSSVKPSILPDTGKPILPLALLGIAAIWYFSSS